MRVDEGLEDDVCDADPLLVALGVMVQVLEELLVDEEVSVRVPVADADDELESVADDVAEAEEVGELVLLVVIVADCVRVDEGLEEAVREEEPLIVALGVIVNVDVDELDGVEVVVAELVADDEPEAEALVVMVADCVSVDVGLDEAVRDAEPLIVELGVMVQVLDELLVDEDVSVRVPVADADDELESVADDEEEGDAEGELLLLVVMVADWVSVAEGLEEAVGDAEPLIVALGVIVYVDVDELDVVEEPVAEVEADADDDAEALVVMVADCVSVDVGLDEAV